jgi:surface antigen
VVVIGVVVVVIVVVENVLLLQMSLQQKQKDHDTNIPLKTQVTGSPYECVVTIFVFKSSCKAKEILTSSIPKSSHYNASQCTSIVLKQRVTPCLFQLFVMSGPGWCLSD